TAIESDFWGWSTFKTAPPPVSIAHPKIAAISGGTSLLMRTTEFSLQMACEAKPETPRWCCIGTPSRVRRRPPFSNAPASLAFVPASQGILPCDLHPGHSPQRGKKVATTWSPTLKREFGEPTRSTMPVASCPNNIGNGLGRSLLTTDRSEWHTPAAKMRSKRSFLAGGSSTKVETLIGVEAT